MTAEAQQEVLNIVFEEEGILNRWPKGKFVRFAEEVQTREYPVETHVSTGGRRGARRRGDAGRLWKDEDSGENEGQDLRQSKRRGEEIDMVQECIAQLPVAQREMALRQMGDRMGETLVPDENAEIAYSATPGEGAVEGIVDDTEPKYDDDRDLSFKDVQEHPERELLLEAASKELKQWSEMDVGAFPGEEELEKIRLRGERILRARMIYKRK